VLQRVEDADPDYVLIFGGDHIYKMDVRLMLERHFDTGADLTVAAIPVPKAEASAFGVIHVDETGRGGLRREARGPAGDPRAARAGPWPRWATTSSTRRARRGAHRATSTTRQRARFRQEHPAEDGRRGAQRVHLRLRHQRHPGRGEAAYWRDIGTVRSYFDAHMDLVAIKPSFNLYNRDWPLRTGMSFEPAGEVRLQRPVERARRHRHRLARERRLHHLGRADPPLGALARACG
jgi:glucose-1-phosphate adenylyltransferase